MQQHMDELRRQQNSHKVQLKFLEQLLRNKNDEYFNINKVKLGLQTIIMNEYIQLVIKEGIPLVYNYWWS